MAESALVPRRQAAVVIPVFADPPHHVVFVERATHLRRHAGEIAFPGGALDDADDGDHVRAALRELHEEIGIPPAGVTIVGRLAPRPQRQNVFTVTPFVGVVAAGTPLIVDSNEASAAHRVPLAAILTPGAVRTGTKTIGERTIETWLFDYGEVHVWGLTGTILNDFVESLRADASPLRAALEAALQVGQP